MNISFKISQTVRVHQYQVFLNDVLVFTHGKNLIGDHSADEQHMSAGNQFATACYKHFNMQNPRFFKMDLMSRWGCICADLLLQHEDLSATGAYKKAIILQNSSSSLLADRNFQQSLQKAASPALFVYTLPNIVMGEMAIRHNFKGENTFFVVSGFDKTQLLDYAGMLFATNAAEVVICGYLEVTDTTQDISMWTCFPA